MTQGKSVRLACACLAIAAASCNPKASYHAPAELQPAQAATLKVRGKLNPFEPAIHPVAIQQIDGKKGPDAGAYGGKWGDLLLAPGPHQLRVAYDDGNRYSIYTGDISFTAEAGKVYQVLDWPPVLTDVTDGKIRRAVKHELKIGPRN